MKYSGRAFSYSVVESDAFLDLSYDVQVLYFHLVMNADDNGIIDNAVAVLRYLNMEKTALTRLVGSGFLLTFPDGLYVVKHWKQHCEDIETEYVESRYKNVLDSLRIDSRSGTYQVKQTEQKQYKQYEPVPLF